MANKTILFVTPELSYSGTPRSTLRMCKVARQIGYNVAIWSAEQGPFEREFRSQGFSVRIVPFTKLRDQEIIALIKTFDLAVCNTILTDEFARVSCRYVPTVWYIREATNVPYFINNEVRRQDWLENSRDIVCVSEYASKALQQYTKHKISIFKNCVEDEADKYTKVTPGSGQTVRFIQLGTIEYRKGYDVLLQAFQQLPPPYQKKAELFFAGRIIAPEADYAQNILQKTEKMDSVTYLGELTGSDVMKTFAEMDVVVVASRDESCSLVALEGAMMSKPLIVTENVGANYIVKEDNGIIVKTGSARCLQDSIMRMIDLKESLKDMGNRSRVYYEEMASMDIYRREMEKLFSRSKRKNSIFFIPECIRNKMISSEIVFKYRQNKKRGRKYLLYWFLFGCIRRGKRLLSFWK
jgi:glycosyltransferase involved in cell wall biosynthesis